MQLVWFSTFHTGSLPFLTSGIVFLRLSIKLWPQSCKSKLRLASTSRFHSKPILDRKSKFSTRETGNRGPPHHIWGLCVGGIMNNNNGTLCRTHLSRASRIGTCISHIPWICIPQILRSLPCMKGTSKQRGLCRDHCRYYYCIVYRESCLRLSL